MSAVAKYIRNTTSGRVELLDIDSRQFYGFIQAAAMTYVMLKKESSLKTSPFTQKLVKCYSRMLSKPIDKIYPISHTDAGYVTMTYILSVYALKVIMGYTLEDALEVSRRTSEGAKALVDTVYRTLSEDKELKMEKFDDVIQLLEVYIENLRPGQITYRSISRQYARMYGVNAVWAIESLTIFFQMIQMANIWLGLYQDKSIQVQSAAYYKDLEKLISTVEI
jgi:hypothetical protein